MYLIIGFAIVLGLVLVGILFQRTLMRYGRADAGSKSSVCDDGDEDEPA